jgi:hypothetical protein
MATRKKTTRKKPAPAVREPDAAIPADQNLSQKCRNCDIFFDVSLATT